MKDQNKVAMGKKSRKDGLAFEKKVRADLESCGFIVAKWANNIIDGEIKPAKNLFRFGRPMGMGNGFPDFIAFTNAEKTLDSGIKVSISQVRLVEAKLKGILDREEKEKVEIYKKNKINVWLASGKTGEIVYTQL